MDFVEDRCDVDVSSRRREAPISGAKRPEIEIVQMQIKINDQK